MTTKVTENQQTAAFVLLPHKLQETTALKPKHLLVYAAIRAHMNSHTRCAFPSHEHIAKMLGMNRSTVGAIIRQLLRSGAIADASDPKRRNRKGKPLAVYHFPPEHRGDHFEPVSKALLLNKQIPWEVKAYIVAALRHMLKQQDGYGIMRLSVSQIAARLHISPSAVVAYHDRLAQLGLHLYDHEDRIFMLAQMGQAPQPEARKQPTETERMLLSENEELRQQVDLLHRQNADQQAQLDHIGRLMAGVKGIPNRRLVRHVLDKEHSRQQRAADSDPFIMTT